MESLRNLVRIIEFNEKKDEEKETEPRLKVV